MRPRARMRAVTYQTSAAHGYDSCWYRQRRSTAQNRCAVQWPEIGTPYGACCCSSSDNRLEIMRLTYCGAIAESLKNVVGNQRNAVDSSLLFAPCKNPSSKRSQLQLLTTTPSSACCPPLESGVWPRCVANQHRHLLTFNQRRWMHTLQLPQRRECLALAIRTSI